MSNKKEINRDVIIKSFTKMVSDKESVRAYIKGETTLKAITKKGIKLARPL